MPQLLKMLGVINTSLTMVVAKVWDHGGSKFPPWSLAFASLRACTCTQIMFACTCTCSGSGMHILCTSPVANWGSVAIGIWIPSSTLPVDGSPSNMEPFGLSVGIWGQVLPTLGGAPPKFPTLLLCLTPDAICFVSQKSYTSPVTVPM